MQHTKEANNNFTKSSMFNRLGDVTERVFEGIKNLAAKDWVANASVNFALIVTIAVAGAKVNEFVKEKIRGHEISATTQANGQTCVSQTSVEGVVKQKTQRSNKMGQ